MVSGSPARQTPQPGALAMDALVALLLLSGGSKLVPALLRAGSSHVVARCLLLVGILDALTGVVVYGYRHARWGTVALLVVTLPFLGIYGYTSYSPTIRTSPGRTC
jgi:uncharacterized membrane protein